MAPENKSAPLYFRVTRSQRKLIEQQAEKLDLRLSEYVRLCVLSDLAARQKVEPEKVGV
jgi:uncharacterized protein (DUF1778 family)